MSIITDIFSGATGGVVKSIGDVVDKFVTTKEEKLQAELELKKADQQYEIDMKRLSVEEQGIYLADTQSARKRESDIATSKDAPWYTKAVSPFLAVLTTLLTFGLFYILMFGQDIFYYKDPITQKLAFDQNKKDIIIYILGVLSAVVTQIFSYYFGSSQGSADKSRQIDNFRMDAAKAVGSK